MGGLPLTASAEGDAGSAPAGNPVVGEAQVLSAGLSLAGQSAAALLDWNARTKLKLKGYGPALTVSAAGPVCAVSFRWDSAPSLYRITAGGGTQTVASDGFLHELVFLEHPAAAFSIDLLSDAVLCDVRFYGEGDLPADVQRWQPPHETADLLALPTHADDEHLYLGGTLPAYIADPRGIRVQVAYLTEHFAEPHRYHELLDGLYAVGVRAYPVFSGFPDYYAASLEEAEKLYDKGAMTDYITGLLRRFRPLVVVAQDENGEYGHGAHRLGVACLKEAAELAADPGHAVGDKNWSAWDVPKIYLHLYGERPVVMDWNRPLERFGGKTAFEMAVAGYACHTSQHIYYFAVKQSGAHDCRLFGLYRTAVGDDSGANDFFEHVDLSRGAPAPGSEAISSPPPAGSAPESVPQSGGEGGESTPHDTALWAGVAAALAAGAGLFRLIRRRRA